MGSSRSWARVVVVLACVLAPLIADAHALSPSLLSLRESGGGVVEVAWKTPLLRLPGVDLRPVLPVDCTVAAPAELTEESDSMIARWRVACPPDGLVGRSIGVQLTDDLYVRRWRSFFEGPEHMKPSLAVDIEEKRPHELQWLTGTVVSLAERSKTAAPLHRRALKLLGRSDTNAVAVNPA